MNCSETTKDPLVGTYEAIPQRLLALVRKEWERTTAGELVFTVGLAAAYVLTARLGLTISTYPDSVTLVWPPSGIALAAVLLFGYRVWPGIALGAVIAIASTGAPLVLMLATALGSTAEALFGAYLLRSLVDFDRSFRRVRDVIAFSIVAVFVSTMIAATLGALGVCLSGIGPWMDFFKVWRIWWLGDAMGVLTITPMLLIWLGSRTAAAESGSRFLEFLSLLVLLLLVGGSVYGGWLPPVLAKPLTFAAFPLVIWGALRFGQHGAVTAAFVSVAVAVFGTIEMRGPFVQTSMNMSLVYLYAYSVVMIITGLVLGATIAERRAAEDGLRVLSRGLEDRVVERTAALKSELVERTHAQEALRESETRFRAIFENAGMGMALITADGKLIHSNATLQSILGYREEELLRFTLQDIMYPDDLAREMAYIRESFVSGRVAPYVAETRYVRKDGKIVWGHVTATFLRDSHGQITNVLCMIEDITRRKLSEEEREKLLRELQQAMVHVKTLSGLLPICSSCKKIRDDQGYWTQVERYLMDHTDAQFSHGICPDCLHKLYPEYADKSPESKLYMAADQPKESRP
jgi:PAS domain S-box-containing protein